MRLRGREGPGPAEPTDSQRWWDRIEALAPLLLLLIFGLAYNEIGEAAGRSGRDFGPMIETGIDSRLPLLPIFIVPYSLFWIYPVVLFAYLYWKIGWRSNAYRRLLVSLVILIACCVVVWWWFPVRVGLRAGDDTLKSHGLLGAAVALTYWAATPWNACPSFHVAGAWFLLRAVQLHARPTTPVLPIVVSLIIVSTVLIRIHYVLDVVVGLAVSEAVFRWVLRPLENSGRLEAMPATIVRAVALMILGGSVAAYLALLLG